MPKRQNDLHIPDSIAQLLRGDRGGLDTALFPKRFARAQFVYLEGFNEFISACVLDGGFKDRKNAAYAINGCAAEARRIVPPTWIMESPTARWTECHAEQVGYAKAYFPLCIDRALLLILALAIACKRDAFGALHKLSPFDFITIHPAIYRLDGHEVWATLRKELSRRMRASERELIASIPQLLQGAAPRDPKKATLKRAEAVLSLAFEGRGMTWKNADLLQSIFNDPIFGPNNLGDAAPGRDCLKKPMKIAVLDGRNDGGRFKNSKRCNEMEGPFVTLSKEDHLALLAAVEKSSEAFRRSR
jgi:hypothetical protein